MALCVVTALLAPPLRWTPNAEPPLPPAVPAPRAIPASVLPMKAAAEDGLAAADRALADVLSATPANQPMPPLRFSGQAGSSLYLSMRRAGLPFDVIKAYLQAVAPHLDFDTDLTSDTRFDLVVALDRDAAGKVQLGALRYAGLANREKQIQLMQDGQGPSSEWADMAHLGAPQRALARPVSDSRISSGFGFRLHPLLGYSRLHTGTDFAATWGAPVHAMAEGRVARAGWSGGYGQMVVLIHPGNLGSGYAHLSQLAVMPGDRVSRGQVIGYVGSTGLSTGPHLHFEVYRNGVAVDPQGVPFVQTRLRSLQKIAALKAQYQALQRLPVFSARRPVATASAPKTAPQ